VKLVLHSGICCVVLAASCLSSEGIHTFDFKNFGYRWREPRTEVPSAWKWLNDSQYSVVRLVDGIHYFSETGIPERGQPYLEFLSTTYGDLTGDGRDEVAVDLLYSTGGTAHWHYLFVYEMMAGSPRLLGVLRSGSRADGGLVRVAIKERLLILEFADSRRRTADCCSEGFVRIPYRWNSTKFVEAGGRTFGDLK
jgi:hypothetical protein